MQKGQAPVVRCVYSDTEKSLACLLEESFRLYLAQMLAGSDGGGGSCPR